MGENKELELEKEVLKNRSYRTAVRTSAANKPLAKKKTVEELLYDTFLAYQTHSLGVIGNRVKQVNQLFSRVAEQMNDRTYQTEKEQLQEQLNDKISKYNELEEQIESIQLENTKLHHEVTRIQESQEEKEKQLFAAEERIKEQKQVIANKELTIEEKGGKIAEKTEQIERLNKEIEVMKQVVSQAEEYKLTSIQLGEQIEDMKKKHDSDLKQKDFALEKVLSEKQKEQIEELSRIQNEHNQRISEENKKRELAKTSYDEKMGGLELQHQKETERYKKKIKALELKLSKTEQQHQEDKKRYNQDMEALKLKLDKPVQEKNE